MVLGLRGRAAAANGVVALEHGRRMADDRGAARLRRGSAHVQRVQRGGHGLAARFCVQDGPFPFPAAVFDPHQARFVFANRGVRLASLGYFGHMWELYAMWAWFVVFFRAVHGPGEGAAYATFAVIGAGALGCVAGGLLGDRWGRSQTTAAMMVASGSCAVVVGLVAQWSAWLALAVGLVWGFTVVADSALCSTIVTELADPAHVRSALRL